MVEHHVAAHEGLADGLRFPEVALYEAHFGDIDQVRERPFREVVEADHIVPFGDQPTAKVGADEPGGAGDEHPHGQEPTGTRAALWRRRRVHP